mgnify:CR=1 FL=1
MTTSTSQNTHETDTANNATYTTISTILTLAIPTFGQLIAEPAFVLIDTAIVGHIGGQALAGLSVGSTIVLTVVGLCVFLAYSTTSQVGRLLGAASGEKAWKQALMVCGWLESLAWWYLWRCSLLHARCAWPWEPRECAA